MNMYHQNLLTCLLPICKLPLDEEMHEMEAKLLLLITVEPSQDRLSGNY
jgi:hypothetical protein